MTLLLQSCLKTNVFYKEEDIILPKIISQTKGSHKAKQKVLWPKSSSKLRLRLFKGKRKKASAIKDIERMPSDEEYDFYWLSIIELGLVKFYIMAVCRSGCVSVFHVVHTMHIKLITKIL